ncbi:MAG: M23 family metallopeptidase [Ferruginibacter sp.]
MKNKLPFFIFALFSFAEIAFSQAPVLSPAGGGSYRDVIKIIDEISPKQRSAIINMLRSNEAILRSANKIATQANTTATAFEWPLKQALGYNDNGFYGISNYVDEDPTFPNNVLDYNCGKRSYDQSSGYNHQGTDIFTWPFFWEKMATNAVEIIAAAPGTIIGKSDGNFDQNCAFCTNCDWNAVYVMQADGSVCWYGHMKLGSLTAKAVGETVAVGEYLGIVGSSGNSTGPHLHFEVYTNSTYSQLVDPWAGDCNNHNGQTSWWANQQPYYVPTISKVMTHGAPPVHTDCNTGEASNIKMNYASGDTLYVGSYYRDQMNGEQATHRIYYPDNTVWQTWVSVFNIYYSASWWWYYLILPATAPTGTWKYEVTYNGKKSTAYFTVNNAPLVTCPLNYTFITSNLKGTTYQWQVDTGSGFTDITDNIYYKTTNSSQLQLTPAVPTSFYGYQYRCLVDAASYSNIIAIKFTSNWTGGKNTAWEDPFNWSCGNVPDSNTDVVIKNDVINFPEINSDAVCRSTSVSPAATLTVNTGFKLTVTH